MSRNELRIVFMGTPEFAVASLDALVKEGYNIVGVITAPDKPAGRGQSMKESEVKSYALKAGLKVLQPTNLKSEVFIEELRSFNANLQVVVAFRMLPEIVWSMPELGTFNLHASLLPKYRGAAPINWAIINGEKETGVTTFFLKHEIDTGDIIMQEKVEIAPDDTASDLHDRLMIAGSKLVINTVKEIEKGDVKTYEQEFSDSDPKAPKIFTPDCEIDWNRPTDAVYNFIRGLSPYPCARTTLNGKTFKIYDAGYEILSHDNSPGEIKTDNTGHLGFYTKDGIITAKTVQLEGKKKMDIRSFLNGYTI